MRVFTAKSEAFRTAPFDVKNVSDACCAPQWQEGERRLRLNRGASNLQIQIIARVDRYGGSGTARTQGSPVVAVAWKGVEATTTEVVLASATVDLKAVRNGYQYVQLFSPEQRGHNDSDAVAIEGNSDGIKETGTTEIQRPRGQVVLRLKWAELGEAESKEGGRDAVLVVRGASGLAKATL